MNSKLLAILLQKLMTQILLSENKAEIMMSMVILISYAAATARITGCDSTEEFKDLAGEAYEKMKELVDETKNEIEIAQLNEMFTKGQN